MSVNDCEEILKKTKELSQDIRSCYIGGIIFALLGVAGIVIIVLSFCNLGIPEFLIIIAVATLILLSPFTVRCFTCAKELRKKRKELQINTQKN